MIIYMCVTSDKYELPIAIADTASELARIMDTTTNNIYSCISRSNTNKRKNSRFKKVVIDDE